VRRRQDFAPDPPRGNVICRVVDASEIAFVAVFLAPDKARAVRRGGRGNRGADGVLLRSD